MTLHYEFPWLANISQVLPLIEGRKEFIVAERDYGVIINYIMQTGNTFPEVKTNDDAILHELRGIIFHKETGKIIARRLHKFFNYGEKMYGEALDVSQRHVVMEKVDGSMITPIFVNGSPRWGTKMGITEIGMAAETFIYTHRNMDYNGLAFDCESLNATPIFEYCSTNPDYQVVVRHPEERLVLLHIRDKITGKYWKRSVVEHFAYVYSVPIVEVYDYKLTDAATFVELIRQNSDVEGVVIQFDDGHMVKVKTDWYLALHRAKAAIEKEKDVAMIIVNDSLDDMLPLQPPEMQERLKRYRDAVWMDIGDFAVDVTVRIRERHAAGESRRDFAIATQAWDHSKRSACFHLWDAPDDADLYNRVVEWTKENIMKSCSSNQNFEKVAYGIMPNARWKEVTNGEG